MFGIQKRRSGNAVNYTEQLNKNLQYRYPTKSLDANIAELRALFKDDDTMKYRCFENRSRTIRFTIAFADGVVDSDMINRSIIRPLMEADDIQPGKGLIDTLINRFVIINEAQKATNFKDIVEGVTYGETVLFADGDAEALILNTKKFEIRSVEEPNNEKTLSGPREGYTELILTNLSLVRRKIRSNDLKMRFSSIGKRTKTSICVCYLESLAKQSIIDELYKRLERIDIDAVLDSNYLIELISDAPYSPFSSLGYTERPDVTVGRLLEGRIAVFVDGSPVVLTLPYLFIENLQSSEDYYLNYFYSSFSRLLRIIGLILTVSVPGLFISVVAYHHELMPTNLVISLASERKNVPLPAILECVVMLGVFELIKETGSRMPSNIGQALSIVGALVIGEAAVQARLVAAPMIIVVAITGISSMAIPKMAAAILYIRILLLFLSAAFGFYGFALGGTFVLIHVLNLRSFGVPQISLAGQVQMQSMKDIVFRAPWFKMNTRPHMVSKDPVRERTNDAQSKD